MTTTWRSRACLAAFVFLAFRAPVLRRRSDRLRRGKPDRALKEVAQGFEKSTGHKVVFNLGASNDLARQIKAGAPADVFFSADKAQMDGLEQAGFVRAQDRVDVLSNVLVAVVPAASTARLSGPKDLLSVKHLALADPQAVPAGVYARTWLECVGLWERTQGQGRAGAQCARRVVGGGIGARRCGDRLPHRRGDLEAGEGRLRSAEGAGARHRLSAGAHRHVQPTGDRGLVRSLPSAPRGKPTGAQLRRSRGEVSAC